MLKKTYERFILFTEDDGAHEKNQKKSKKSYCSERIFKHHHYIFNITKYINKKLNLHSIQ